MAGVMLRLGGIWQVNDALDGKTIDRREVLRIAIR